MMRKWVGFLFFVAACGTSVSDINDSDSGATDAGSARDANVGVSVSDASSSDATPDATTMDASDATVTDANDAAIVDASDAATLDGGTDGSPISAFATAPAYMMGTATAIAKGQAGHLGSPTTSAGQPIPANGDPSGMNCQDSKCHGTGGAGTAFSFAGTFVGDAGNPTTGFDFEGIEVRVCDATGKEIDHVYCDAQGNFFSTRVPEGGPPEPDAGTLMNIIVGTRLQMQAPLAATMKNPPPTHGACNAAGCHAGRTTPMLQ